MLCSLIGFKVKFIVVTLAQDKLQNNFYKLCSAACMAVLKETESFIYYLTIYIYSYTGIYAILLFSLATVLPSADSGHAS